LAIGNGAALRFKTGEGVIDRATVRQAQPTLTRSLLQEVDQEGRMPSGERSLLTLSKSIRLRPAALARELAFVKPSEEFLLARRDRSRPQEPREVLGIAASSITSGKLELDMTPDFFRASGRH
jgi:hypothetical protein